MNYCMTNWYNPAHPEWYDAGVRENLVQIRGTGFTHINWNPDAGSSYLYSRAEMEHIDQMIRESGLFVKTIHAAHGHHHVMEIESAFQDRRKDITSLTPWRRQAGIELVENRLIFARLLGCDNMVLHIPFSEDTSQITSVSDPFMRNLFQALDAIRPVAERERVCIAVENLQNSIQGTKFLLDALFDRYPVEYMAWCYDSGHANNVGLDFDLLYSYKERMVATHLHDNWGVKDDHLLPGDGNIDWNKAAKLIAESIYDLPLNYETPPGRYSLSYKSFYDKAYASIVTLTNKVVAAGGAG